MKNLWDKTVDPMAKVGMRVRLIQMVDDPNPIDDKLEGTIDSIDDLGTLHVNWDDGRRLGVVPEIDKYELLPPSDEQIDLEDMIESFATDKSKINKSMPKPTVRNSKLAKKFRSELKKAKPKVRDIKVEGDLEETSTAGGVSTGHFEGPLGGKDETIIKKPFAKQIGKELTGKKSISNPIGKIYTILPKTESKIFKFKNIVNEISSTSASKLRGLEGSYDGNAWVGAKKDGWNFNDKSVWKGGEIVDKLAKLNINWKDSDLTLTNSQTDNINEKFVSKAQQRYLYANEPDVADEFNSTMTSNDYEELPEKVKKKKKKKEDVDETTTHASVWGANGPPVVPIFGAKGKDHIPSRKPIWKGGKIVQKIKNDGVLTENEPKSKLFQEINKIKWVKGGKFVKIKDKCAKYNNQPWCSQGAIDNPLELSDTTFENVEKISKKIGMKEDLIIDTIMSKVNEVTLEKKKYNKRPITLMW
jgi:hypothetical protein